MVYVQCTSGVLTFIQYRRMQRFYKFHYEKTRGYVRENATNPPFTRVLFKPSEFHAHSWLRQFGNRGWVPGRRTTPSTTLLVLLRTSISIVLVPCTSITFCFLDWHMRFTTILVVVAQLPYYCCTCSYLLIQIYKKYSRCRRYKNMVGTKY
jgi:hypothetical protein